jgi:hypothetical protein
MSNQEIFFKCIEGLNNIFETQFDVHDIAFIHIQNTQKHKQDFDRKKSLLGIFISAKNGHSTVTLKIADKVFVCSTKPHHQAIQSKPHHQAVPPKPQHICIPNTDALSVEVILFSVIAEYLSKCLDLLDSNHWIHKLPRKPKSFFADFCRRELRNELIQSFSKSMMNSFPDYDCCPKFTIVDFCISNNS